MFSRLKFDFTRRCYFLFGVAMLSITWLASTVINIQTSELDKNQNVNDKEGLISETILPQRGRIMDAREEILTNNQFSHTLIVDGHQVTDPKTICTTLGYAIAVHSERWAKATTDKDKTKVARYFRSKLLAQALNDKESDKEHSLAQILISEEPTHSDSSTKQDDKYLPEVVRDYQYAFLDYAAELLCPYLTGISKEDFIAKVKKQDGSIPKGRIVICKNLASWQVEKIKEIIDHGRIVGIRLEESSKRVYSSPECLTHVIGYIAHTAESGPYPIALAGLEKELDDLLMGRNGLRQYRKDNNNRIIPSKDSNFIDAVDGQNVRLSVNMDYQAIIEEELDAALNIYTDETHKPRGCIIVIEPKTGSILAIASRPHYNLNTRKGISEGAFHYAVQGLYEPGSTFKVIAATAAVDSGKAKFDTPISCRPCTDHGVRVVTDSPRSLGDTNVAGVLRVSSNPGAYRVAQKAGPEIYEEYIRKFGLREPVDIQLSGAAKPQMQPIFKEETEPNGKKKKIPQWTNFSRLTYGYATTVSPLHIAMIYATIANNGVRMKPRLIDGIYHNNGTFQYNPPVEICRVMKESTAKGLKDALFHVTDNNGTAKNARVPDYDVGGKTGTAHKTKPSGGYYTDRYTVSFVGMLPAHDPRFICLVVIEDPTTALHKVGGGSVCAPIFRKVATRLAAVMNIPKTGNNNGKPPKPYDPFKNKKKTTVSSTKKPS